MNETGETRRRGTELWLGCSLLPVIYFASYLGIAVLLRWLHWDLPPWLESITQVVYYPIDYAYDHWGWFKEITDWIYHFMAPPP